MTEQHFQRQVTRLADTFGKNHYGQERVALLWREIGEFSDSWMTRTVDRFIGELRQAPLWAEFREAASRERERLWNFEKKQHEQDAQDFFRSTYHSEEVGIICQTITARMRGKFPDRDWDNFVKALENQAKRGAA